MKKRNDKKFYDVTAHLVERFGPVGSDAWKAEEDRAWEEYNADILRNARKEAGITQVFSWLKAWPSLQFKVAYKIF